MLAHLRDKAASKEVKDGKAESKKKAAKDKKKDSDSEGEDGDGDGDKEAGEEESAPKKRKRAGGVSVPEEWPWEEAKKVFQKPDVTPADQVEVRPLLCYL